MEKIYIVTDSTADIPKNLAESLGITVVPLKVHFKDETYLDGVTISAEQFYEKLNESEDLPTTSQPSPVDFVDTYKQLVKDDKDAKIVSIHLSSAVSGTCQSAYLAQSMVAEEGIEVNVIDSKKASYSIGIIVVEVAEAIKNGKSYNEVVELANQLVESTQIYFLVDTLTYLHKGGRIGKAASLFGSLLNIKPILSLNENGEVYPVDKVRGRSKAADKVIELFENYAKNKKVKAGISHAVNLEDAKKYEQLIKDKFNVQDFVLTEIGPVIGTHVGPGALAITMIAL